MFCADDLPLHSESVETFKKIEHWKGGLESKGLRVNVNELAVKLMIISMEAEMVRKEEKFPLSLGGKGEGTYSISYQFWEFLMCKRFICVRVRL